DPAAMTPRAHVAARRARGGEHLERDLPQDQDDRARDVEPVREERAVAGIRALLRVRPADGEDAVYRLPGQQVAAARPAVDEQALPGAVPPLDLGAVRWRGAGDEPLLRLLDPAE